MGYLNLSKIEAIQVSIDGFYFNTENTIDKVKTLLKDITRVPMMELVLLLMCLKRYN